MNVGYRTVAQVSTHLTAGGKNNSCTEGQKIYVVILVQIIRGKQIKYDKVALNANA